MFTVSGRKTTTLMFTTDLCIIGYIEEQQNMSSPLVGK